MSSKTETQCGPLTVTRQKDGIFRVVDKNGAGVGTFGSWADAMKAWREHNATSALVRLVGKDEAIEMLRSGYKV